MPIEARLYIKNELTRNSRAVWGIDAPVTTFSGQIHQESQWKTTALSPWVCPLGLAQFMPATSSWIAISTPLNWKPNRITRHDRFMRALVQYKRWNWQHIPATASNCDRMACTLSAYNGRLG
ncbi:MAG: hypothetical protein ACSLEN_14245 [Candidatus Malihini olakiniferum]